MQFCVSAEATVWISHFFEYLRLAWTFSGGELPTFIWLFSIVAFLPLAVLSVIYLRRYGRLHREHDH